MERFMCTHHDVIITSRTCSARLRVIIKGTKLVVDKNVITTRRVPKGQYYDVEAFMHCLDCSIGQLLINTTKSLASLRTKETK